MKRQLLHKHRKLGKEKCVKFFSVKSSYPLIRRTRFPYLGRWIIYRESTKNNYGILKITNTKDNTKNKTVFIPEKAHKQNLPSYQHTVCVCVRPSEIFRASYPLFSIVVFRETTSTEQNTQSAYYSSSSVDSSAKGTARSVFEAYKM
jgi:hypothetical protein